MQITPRLLNSLDTVMNVAITSYSPQEATNGVSKQTIDRMVQDYRPQLSQDQWASSPLAFIEMNFERLAAASPADATNRWTFNDTQTFRQTIESTRPASPDFPKGVPSSPAPAKQLPGPNPFGGAGPTSTHTPLLLNSLGGVLDVAVNWNPSRNERQLGVSRETVSEMAAYYQARMSPQEFASSPIAYVQRNFNELAAASPGDPNRWSWPDNMAFSQKHMPNNR